MDGSDEPVAQAAANEPDPELLARWIGVAQLLASAGELQLRHGGAWPGLALITADTANEAILGLIAVSGDQPPTERDHFDQVYSLALAVLAKRNRPMPHGLRTSVLQVHRARNLAVHLGAEPAPKMVQTSLKTAAALRTLAIDALEALEAFRHSGPVRAVAQLVGIEDISTPLSEAERLLAEDKPAEAADQAAIALHAALGRVTPALRPWRRAPWRVREVPRDLSDTLESLSERAERQEAWILATVLGLRPRELANLQRTLGTPIYTMGGPQPHSIPRRDDVVLSRPVVESALLLTTDIVYRLWQGDSLRTGDRPWDEE